MTQRFFRKLIKLQRIFIITISFNIFTGILIAQGKFSGYMFGDFYYILSHHRGDLKGQNGFWFRRIYFTYDFQINDNWSTRFRVELNSYGDFKTKDTLKPYVKDAYLQYKKGNHNIYLGISPTPTWEYIESFWGYRSVEKTPLDLFKMGDSRDFGLAFRGFFGKEKRFGYHLQLANGEGTKSEVNKYKKIMSSFLFNLNKSLSFEVYGDYGADGPGKEVLTYQGFIGWKQEKARLGLMYCHQTRGQGSGQADIKLNLLSALAVLNPSAKISLLFRYDRAINPIPGVSTQSYVPLNSESPFHLIIAGIDLKILKNISFIPNIMLVTYETTEGVKPKSDAHFKLTFFYSF